MPAKPESELDTNLEIGQRREKELDAMPLPCLSICGPLILTLYEKILQGILFLLSWPPRIRLSKALIYCAILRA